MRWWRLRFDDFLSIWLKKNALFGATNFQEMMISDGSMPSSAPDLPPLASKNQDESAKWEKLQGTVLATTATSASASNVKDETSMLPEESFANIKMAPDEPPVTEESIQEGAITDMLKKVVLEDEVAGPTSVSTQPSKATQVPSRAPSVHSSSKSDSGSSSSSDSSMSSVRRRRRGPAPHVAPPPGLAPASSSAAPIYVMHTPRGKMTNRYQVDLQEVQDHNLFDLETLEHAFSQDVTHTKEALMNIDSRLGRAAMKKMIVRTMHRRLRIYADGNCFIVRPPKVRASRAQRAMQPAADMPIASQASAAATPHIAKRVAVVLTPGPGPAPKAASAQEEQRRRRRPRPQGPRPPAGPPPPFPAWPSAPPASASSPPPRAPKARGPKARGPKAQQRPPLPPPWVRTRPDSHTPAPREVRPKFVPPSPKSSSVPAAHASEPTPPEASAPPPSPVCFTDVAEQSGRREVLAHRSQFNRPAQSGHSDYSDSRTSGQGVRCAPELLPCLRRDIA